jgi:hypothetical protein
MRKALIPAFLLILGALVLSVTVFGEPIAGASIPFSNVIVGNTTTNPVPVDVQNASLPVTGTVTVGNLPTTQSVSGTVNIGNLPSTQQVAVNENTTQLASVVGAVVPGGAFDFTIPGNDSFDATGSQTIRVTVQSTEPITMTLFEGGVQLRLDRFQVPDFVSKTYDVPGDEILYSFDNPNGSDAFVSVQVYGRA